MNFRRTFSFLLAAACWLPSPLHADVIYEYEGAFFTDIFPSLGGLDLTTADRVTGRFVFDDLTSTSARSIQLSTTVAGGPGWEFHIPDTSAIGPFTILANDFTFLGTEIVSWDVEIFGEAFGDPLDEEQIWISEGFGDLASIDFGGFEQSTAFTATPGSFTAVPEPSVVPEPSSVLVFAVGGGIVLYRRRRSATRSSDG